jgi:hypothetical protein
MSEYTTSDLHYSLEVLCQRVKVEITRENIETVHYAWGRSPEGYGSWEGGFILELKDGRFATIEGWCDTTGWGCQDGVTVTFKEDGPHPWETKDLDGDPLPADLNRWVKGEFDVD